LDRIDQDQSLFFGGGRKRKKKDTRRKMKFLLVSTYKDVDHRSLGVWF
jgi:hypothetical protein